MIQKLHWVRWFPSDFLHGTSTLTPHEFTVYTKILMLMYDRGGGIKYDPSGLARICNMRRPQLEKAMDKLFELGKLQLANDHLLNERCQKELVRRANKQHQNSNNANKRWSEEPKKLNENNGEVMRTQCDRNATAMPILDTKNYNLLARKNNHSSIVGEKVKPARLATKNRRSYKTLNSAQSGSLLEDE